MVVAGVFQSEEEYVTSARLQGVVVAIMSEIGTTLSVLPMEKGLFDSTAKALKESMGAQAYQTEFETGMALTLNEALALVSGRN